MKTIKYYFVLIIIIIALQSCYGLFFSNPSYSPLFNAIENNDLSLVKILLNKGENPNSIYPNRTSPHDYFYWWYYKETPIFFAASNGNIEILDYLLQNGADINKRNYYGSNVLMQACYWRQVKIVKYLIEKGVDVNETNNFGQTALSAATGDFTTNLKVFDEKYYDAMHDDTTIVYLLIQKGANVNVISKSKEDYGEIIWSPLSAAVNSGQFKIARLLLRHGASNTLNGEVIYKEYIK